MKGFGWLTNGLGAVIAALSTAPPEMWADRRVIVVAVTTFLLGALRSGREERKEAKGEEIRAAIEEALKSLEGKVEADAEVMNEVYRELLSELEDVATELQAHDWRIGELEGGLGKLDERVGELEDSMRRAGDIPDELYAAVGSYRMGSSQERMRRFHDFLKGKFRLDQIEVVAKRAGIDWDEIPGDTKGLRAWNLIEEAKRAGLLEALVGEAVEERPSGMGLLREIVGEAGESKKGRKGGEARVSLSKLPVTGRELFGRDDKLGLLDEAWEDEGTKILSFVAWGGVGKTALVNEWLNRMGEKGWGGAECVYGWSFYSQGTKEDRQANSDAFFLHALEWFGDKETAKSKKSAWDKGVRLAELVRGQKTLLILDGVEPLQHPPGPMAGRLKDQGLQGLLRELSHGMEGLCVVTTREKIEDLKGQVGHTVRRVELENLGTEAGVKLLKRLGVKTGSKKEFEEAVEEVKGHALALNLLGTFVATVHDGDIRKRDKIEKLASEEEEKGGHAKHVMGFYERWLRKKNKAEVDMLYLMGLFDRPAEEGAIEALRKKPAIKGLTGNMVNLSEAKWKYAVKRLRELKLLAVDDGSGDLDCHPLVREHFGEKVKAERPGAWREAHGRLYEYYKGVPEKEQPDTLDEMAPLFRAVYHGCAAGRYQETLDDVYWQRINRGKAYFVMKQLGAFGSWLGAAACFFEKPWDRPASGLSEDRKAVVLNHAGLALRAVGRLGEAVGPSEASLKLLAAQKNSRQAAQQASNVSELYLTLGDVGKAVEYGRSSAEYADKSGDWDQRMIGRTTLADALHRAGEVAEARRLFEEAERIQQEKQPEYRYLYSTRGYHYCDLLISLGAYSEVKERARQTLEWDSEEGRLLDMGLDRLSLGRALLAEAASKIKGQKSKCKSAEKSLHEAKRWLDEAVDGLRGAGTQHHIPRGLLARAGYWRAVGDYEEALGDLEEAREIAERGDMKLWLADYHLENARLARSEKDKEKMAEHYAEAKRLLEECGYHRRDGEVEDLEEGRGENQK